MSGEISSACGRLRQGYGAPGSEGRLARIKLKGHPLVGGLVRDPDAVPTQAPGRRVGEVVAGVGEERETVREPSTHRLNDYKAHGERHGGTHDPAGHARRNVRVGVRVCVMRVHVAGMMPYSSVPRRITKPTEK